MEIKVGEIYSFKLTSGQEVVGKVEQIDDDGYHLEEPLTIGQGQKGMEFMQVMFTVDFGKPGKLYHTGISMVMPTREDVKEAYDQSIHPSTIVKPGPKQIITG